MSTFDTTRQTATRDTSRSETAYDMGLRRHMLQVYNYMASGVLLTGIVAMACSATGVANLLYGDGGATVLGIVAALAPLAYIFILGKRLRGGSLAKGQVAFWSFTALMGVSLSSISLQYTGLSIATSFFATAAAFAGLSLYGYGTRRDLSAIGTFLVMALWGLIATLVINIFVGSPAMGYAASAAGVLIFAGLTAVDTQKAREAYRDGVSADTNERAAIWSALELYLDFINLMISLLRIFGVKIKD